MSDYSEGKNMPGTLSPTLLFYSDTSRKLKSTTLSVHPNQLFSKYIPVLSPSSLLGRNPVEHYSLFNTTNTLFDSMQRLLGALAVKERYGCDVCCCSGPSLESLVLKPLMTSVFSPQLTTVSKMASWGLLKIRNWKRSYEYFLYLYYRKFIMKVAMYYYFHFCRWESWSKSDFFKGKDKK